LESGSLKPEPPGTLRALSRPVQGWLFFYWLEVSSCIMAVFEKVKEQFDPIFAFVSTDAEHHLPFKDQVKVHCYPLLPDL
jgi:hypothetical protein